MPFFDAVAARFETQAGTPFLIEPSGATVTHGEALRRAGQLAAALGRAGIGAGDRLAVKVEKSADAVLLYLACLRARIVYVPMNPAFRSEETAHILADAEPAALVCMPGHEAGPGVRAVGLGALVADAHCGAVPERVGAGSDDLAVILYTSGTTGRPKGAMLGAGNILANGEALARFWRFTAEDVLLHAVPLFHSHGLFVSLSCTLLSGSAALITPGLSADQAMALLPRATVFMGVPTMYTRLLATPGFGREICAGVRLFACGSAPLSPADHAAFAARTGHVIVERYGMSETAVNAANPIGGARPGTVGPALPGVEIRTQGRPGAVQVRGAHVFGGYWRRPEQTAAAFTADRWFDTGDIGQVDAQGYLTLVGRAKDLIITGGYNVYPLEVELVLQDIPGVLEAAVFGLSHADYGEAVTAAVVVRAGADFDEAGVIAAVKERLAPYKAPKRVVAVAGLPRNAIGKVMKAELQAMHAGLYGA